MNVLAGSANPAVDNPFDLDNEAAYAAWRDARLQDYPRQVADLMVEVADPRKLTAAEKNALQAVLKKTNMVIYSSQLSDLEDKSIPKVLGREFGLEHLDPNMLADDDGVTSLTVVEGKLKRGYIPYSDKRLLWHTDGYYNTPEQQIRAFILHCVRPAPKQGGINALLDPEMAYIQLRDADPSHIEALMQVDAMTIPANMESGIETRPAQTGPVFSLDSATASLHMRYTARTRSIEWKQDTATEAAVKALESLLSDENPYVFHHKLAAGQGLLANNVLHNRTAFENTQSQQRLIYRARYYDRISGTGLS